jgi:hypothetical protein
MSALSVAFFTLLFVFAYLVSPTMLVWGWARWIKRRPRSWTISSTLSFAGFLLASASALFALWTILYALGGGFEHLPGYSFFYQCLRRGAVLSLLGIAFSVGGVWRRSPLRWQAPASAVGTLAFWLLATTWPCFPTENDVCRDLQKPVLEFVNSFPQRLKPRCVFAPFRHG